MHPNTWGPKTYRPTALRSFLLSTDEWMMLMRLISPFFSVSLFSMIRGSALPLAWWAATVATAFPRPWAARVWARMLRFGSMLVATTANGSPPRKDSTPLMHPAVPLGLSQKALSLTFLPFIFRDSLSMAPAWRRLSLARETAILVIPSSTRSSTRNSSRGTFDTGISAFGRSRHNGKRVAPFPPDRTTALVTPALVGTAKCVSNFFGAFINPSPVSFKLKHQR